MKRFLHSLQLTVALARLLAELVRLIDVIIRMGWV